MPLAPCPSGGHFDTEEMSRLGKKDTGNTKVPFGSIPPLTLTKRNSDLQLFCRSLSRESRHCRTSSGLGLNQELRKKKVTTVRGEFPIHTNKDLDLFFLEMINR